MKPKTRLWLAMPRILASGAGAVAAVLLSWLWFGAVRPDIQSVTDEAAVEPIAADRSAAAKDVPEHTMTLMVLEWSPELSALLERFTQRLESNASLMVDVFHRDGSVKEVSSRLLSGTVDSVWRVNALSYRQPVAFASLGSVLQLGFQSAKGQEATDHTIVMVGRFPELPTDKALNAAGNQMTVLEPQDYSWLKGRPSVNVVFLSRARVDPLREKFEIALADSLIQYKVTTQEDLNEK